MIVFKYLALMVLLGFGAACVQEETSSVSPNQSSLENPQFESLGLDLTYPLPQSSVLGRVAVSGRCSHSGYPIKVTGASLSKTVYSVCQDDFTWAAAFNTAGIAQGSFDIQAEIFEPDYSVSSSPAALSLVKAAKVCDSTNASEIFANAKSGGDGDQTPYIICNSEQFSNIRFYPDKKFVLGRNIDFANRVFSPIAVPFSGELDGQGFLLSNIVVKDIAGNGVSVGLFRYAHGATIRNLNIKNALVQGYQRVGILAGDWRGSGLLESIKVQGKVEGIGYVGGLIGLGNTNFALSANDLSLEVEVSGNNIVGGMLGFIVNGNGSFSIENSKLFTKVSGIDYVGGVIGRSLEESVSASDTERVGNIESLGRWVGGFAGELPGAVLTNFKNVGVISSAKNAEDVFVGGLVGESRGQLIAQGSESVAQISSGGHYTGGVVGKAHSVIITDTHTRGSIQVLDTKYDGVNRFVGGLAGGVGLNSSISNSRSYMDIDVKAQYVGGLIGVMNGEESSITDSFYQGSIAATTSHVGGLAGIFGGNSIERSFSQATITVDGPTPNAFIGGLVGHAQSPAGIYTRLYSKSDIGVSNGIADNVGGLFGYLEGQSLSEGYFKGAISGVRSKVGGIAGYTKAPISHSFAVADLAASFRYVGAIAGMSQEAMIHDVFAKANVQGKGEVGGLVGWLNSETLPIARGYFVGDVVKLPDGVFADSTFGQIVGKTGSQALQNVYYLEGNALREQSGAAFTGNDSGASLTSSQLRNETYYANFEFGLQAWEAPASGFKLPFEAEDFLFAKFDWLLDSNQGFALPEIFSYNPLDTAYPSLFIQDSEALDELDQGLLDVADTDEPPANASPGELVITVESPATNSELITGKKLVYGECGLPGNPVIVSGGVSARSICQENHRWVLVVDAASLPVGTINFSVVMKSLDGATSSNVVSKSMIKPDDLCEQEEAIKGSFANSFLGADGAATPFKICHAGHFANIAFYPDKNFELVNDIDFGGNNLEPIQSVFTGSIDGKNRALKNFVVNKPSSVGAGLFKIIKDAQISNLVIENGFVKGYARSGLLAGSLVGAVHLSNLTVKGQVEGILYTGGIAGLANTNVDLLMEDISSEVTVVGNGYTGGILGHISTLEGSFVARDLSLKNNVDGLSHVGGLIGSSLESNVVFENISQTGDVSAKKENVGGIAGHLRGGTLDNITVEGNIVSTHHAKEANAGGLFGLVELTSFDLNTASFSGSVSAGGDNVGGIAGKLVQGTMTNVQSHGSLSVLDQKHNSVRSYVGGIVGNVAESSSLTNSFSKMALNAKANFVGGLAGRFDGEDSVLTGSFFDGSLEATTSFVGGVAGFFFGETFQDNHSLADINVDRPTPNAYIGGILGYANSWTSNYQRIYATGNITITNGIADYVGGLIGYFRGGSLSECYATGDVAGARSAVGGLVGLHRGLTQFCFASGNVDASFRHAGGLIGYLLNGEIRDSFSLGNIEAKAESGGLLGIANTAAEKISNVYAYGSVSRKAGSDKSLSEFGPILGKDLNGSSIRQNMAFYAGSIANGLQNALGSGLASQEMNSAQNYASFDFESPKSWRMPASGFVLPGETEEYAYPIHEWLGSGQTVSLRSVSGTVSGLNYGQVFLSLNGSEEIAVNPGETTFEFSTTLASGSSYMVTVAAAPGYEMIECSLSNPTGFVGTSNVTNLVLTCPSLNSINVSPLSPLMAVGDTLALQAKGVLSNSAQFDISSEVSWSSTAPSKASVSSGGLVSALAVGETVVEASFLGLSAQSGVTVAAAVAAASNPSWTQSSPHNSVNFNASWTPGGSGNISEQVLLLYENGACDESAIQELILPAVVSGASLTGAHLKQYSFKVRSVSSVGISADSECSPPLAIELDIPEAVAGVQSSADWITGPLPTASPLISWINPAQVNINQVKIGLGSSPGLDDIASFASIGVNNSYTYGSLAGISECVPYYPSVKYVDEFGVESETGSDQAGFRWDNTAPAQVSNIQLAGEATETSTPAFTWSAPAENCGLKFYEIGIGSTPGADDVSQGHRPIANTTSYTAVSGLHGLSFQLTPGVDYYTSIRAVDHAGNRSPAGISEAWQVIDLQASLPELILWLDSEDRLSVFDGMGRDGDTAGFDGRVATWADKSGSLYQHDFTAVNSESRPYYTEGSIFFNGSNHAFTTPNHDEINLATVSEKNISFAIRTENNVDATQVIYEEGGTIRGMNVYISNGRLYCGFWNDTNDGDGAQPFVSASTPISRNKTYSVSWVFDYSNYAGASGPDGSLKCYVNNTLIGQASTTTRVYPHSGAIGIGAKVGDTYYHTGASSGNGDRFRGEILEVMISNQSVDQDVVTNIHNYLTGKWAGEDLSRPNNLSKNNNAEPGKAATVTWEPIDPELFDTAYYEIAVGRTPGGTEDVYWTNIGNQSSYQVQNGVDGVSLSLQAGQDYYISVRAVDSIGNVSQAAISEPWRLFDFQTDISNVILNYDASVLSSLQDKNGNYGDEGNFLGRVNRWFDLSGNGHNGISLGNSAGGLFGWGAVDVRPYYDEQAMTMLFDGDGNIFEIPDSGQISSQTLTSKNITVIFNSGQDVNSRQVIYEEGDETRGMNVYIDSGKVYCGFWNTTEDGDGAQPFVSVSGDIQAGQDHVITWAYDYGDYAGADGPDGKLNCFMNAQLLGSGNTTSRLFAHSGGIGLGGQNDGTRFHNGTDGSARSSFFEGSISDVIINNQALRKDTVQGMHNYLMP